MVTKCNAKTLQAAKYKVRTELGISEDSYSHSQEDPIYGIGQGAGNSSNHWGFITSAAYDGYDTMSTPATYQNPDPTNEIKVSIIGFVDNTNGQANKFTGCDSATVRETTEAIRTSHCTAAQYPSTHAVACSVHPSNLEANFDPKYQVTCTVLHCRTDIGRKLRSKLPVQ